MPKSYKNLFSIYLVALFCFTQNTLLAGTACSTAPTRLCLGAGDRFSVEVEFSNFPGNELSLAAADAAGMGQAVKHNEDTGFFWFVDEGDLSLIVKVLDGRNITGHFWVFAASTSNFEFEMTVRDEMTGQEVSYLNQAGEFATIQDTAAIPSPPPSAAAKLHPKGAIFPAPVIASLASSCLPDDQTLCLLEGRFQVRANWRADDINLGEANAVFLTDRSGALTFFAESNLEVLVRIEDGRSANGNFWFFFGGLTDVAYEITVVDTVTGRSQIFANTRQEAQSFGTAALFVPEVHLAQFGGGAGFSTRLTLFNLSSESAGAALRLFDVNGMELTDAPAAAPDLPLAEGLVIPPDGSITLTTSPQGDDLFLGSLSVLSDRPLGAQARYSLAPGSAAVGTGEVLKRARVPVRQSALLTIRTGVALRNLRTAATNVRLSVLDAEGMPVPGAETEFRVQANQRISQFIDEFFELPEEFEGTLEIEADVHALAVIALELGSAAGDFTSISPVPLP
ncbi:MAG TPA: hypothetical protein VLU25_01355 [Acidobacteriota bacterium]|nr:hypothetical protein [Acidobacteriota bacterium]